MPGALAQPPPPRPFPTRLARQAAGSRADARDTAEGSGSWLIARFSTGQVLSFRDRLIVRGERIKYCTSRGCVLCVVLIAQNRYWSNYKLFFSYFHIHFSYFQHLSCLFVLAQKPRHFNLSRKLSSFLYFLYCTY